MKSCVRSGTNDDESGDPTVRRCHATVHGGGDHVRADSRDHADRGRGRRQRVHTVVAERFLGTRRPTAGAQGRRRGGHRQTVHRQGDAEPTGATAATAPAPSAAAGRGPRTAARERQVLEGRREQPPTGVPAAHHPVDGLVPVDAVQDEPGQRLVLRELQQDQRGAVRQQNGRRGLRRRRAERGGRGRRRGRAGGRAFGPTRMIRKPQQQYRCTYTYIYI